MITKKSNPYQESVQRLIEDFPEKSHREIYTIYADVRRDFIQEGLDPAQIALKTEEISRKYLNEEVDYSHPEIIRLSGKHPEHGIDKIVRAYKESLSQLKEWTKEVGLVPSRFIRDRVSKDLSNQL